MNRYLYQFRYSFERDVVEYFLKVSIGAAGAPTIVNAKGISSITRNSAGNYTIALQDNSYMLLDVASMILNATAPAAPLASVISEQVNSSSAPEVIMQYRDAASVATDPGSGEVLLIRITVRNAST